MQYPKGRRVMGDRSEKVGERGQMFTILRRIVGLCSRSRNTEDGQQGKQDLENQLPPA